MNCCEAAGTLVFAPNWQLLPARCQWHDLENAARGHPRQKRVKATSLGWQTQRALAALQVRGKRNGSTYVFFQAAANWHQAGNSCPSGRNYTCLCVAEAFAEDTLSWSCTHAAAGRVRTPPSRHPEASGLTGRQTCCPALRCWPLRPSRRSRRPAFPHLDEHGAEPPLPNVALYAFCCELQLGLLAAVRSEEDFGIERGVHGRARSAGRAREARLLTGSGVLLRAKPTRAGPRPGHGRAWACSADAWMQSSMSLASRTYTVCPYSLRHNPSPLRGRWCRAFRWALQRHASAPPEGAGWHCCGRMLMWRLHAPRVRSAALGPSACETSFRSSARQRVSTALQEARERAYVPQDDLPGTGQGQGSRRQVGPRSQAVVRAAGLDLVPFQTWLPAAAQAEVREKPTDVDIASGSRELDTAVKGVPLSRLLGGVAAAVARAFSESVWTTAEVVRASSSKGHYYLELSERNAAGDVLAQARAVIWARQAQTLLAEFKRATGADLDAGIKVLIRAKPVFKANFGFSLEVDGIDPSYTLGDLEANKREIRERLKREGLFDRNRRLPAPGTIHPFSSSPLKGRPVLATSRAMPSTSRLTGSASSATPTAASKAKARQPEIVAALSMGLRTWAGSTMPDAVVIIRGGGSVNDLAWLNDYDLARCVCECPVPVLTGIGHERDETSIDEVAHRRFDTPSKVIAGLKEVIQARAREAQQLAQEVFSRTRTDLAEAASSALNAREAVDVSGALKSSERSFLDRRRIQLRTTGRQGITSLGARAESAALRPCAFGCEDFRGLCSAGCAGCVGPGSDQSYSECATRPPGRGHLGTRHPYSDCRRTSKRQDWYERSHSRNVRTRLPLGCQRLGALAGALPRGCRTGTQEDPTPRIRCRAHRARRDLDDCERGEERHAHRGEPSRRRGERHSPGRLGTTARGNVNLKTQPEGALPMEATTFRAAYEVLQRHAQTLRDQDEPNIDDLLDIVNESVAAYKVCKQRIDAVEKAARGSSRQCRPRGCAPSQ